MLEGISRALRAGFIGARQLAILLTVNDQPGIYFRDIVDTLEIPKACLSQMLNVMEIQGYVRRRANINDRRRLHIDITAAGRRLARNIQGD